MTNTEAKLRTLVTVALFGLSLFAAAFGPDAKVAGVPVSVAEGELPEAVLSCLLDLGYRGRDDGREALYPLAADLAECG